MGAKKQKKLEFLRNHPLCCFCGGINASEEPDHIPSRALFLDRQWPEGYVFPSCIKCNRASRYDELVVSLISRLYPDPTTDQEIKELKQCAESVNNYMSDIIGEIQISAAKKKRLIKKYEINIPPDKTSKDIPLISLDGVRTNEAVLSFSRKLMFALYYKHTGSILPNSGAAAVIWYSDFQVQNGAIPEQVNNFLTEAPELVRNSRNLNDQFNYKYILSECNQSAAFLVNFRRSFWVLGHLKEDHSSFDKSVYGKNLMFPYQW